MAYLETISFVAQGVVILYGLYISLFAAAGVVKRRKWADLDPTSPLRRFAILIPARDEESSIGQVLGSLRSQNYPRENFDVYVVADNCVDATAEVARGFGAISYERSDDVNMSKGYALEFLFDRISERNESYDGFVILDADNIAHPSFLSEVNKALANGCHVIQGQWQAQNLNNNWITRLNHASASLAALEQQGRLNLGLSCGLSGTGMAFSASAIQSLGGWKVYSLLEDMEMQALCVSNGIRVVWWPEAITFDETTSSLQQASKQRLRWVRGGFQVFWKYCGRLLFDGVKSLDIIKVEHFLWISRSLIPRSILIFLNFLFLILSIWEPFGTAFLPWQVWAVVFCGNMLSYVVGLATQKAKWQSYAALVLSPAFIALWSWAFFRNLFIRTLLWPKTRHTSTVTVDEVLRDRR